MTEYVVCLDLADHREHKIHRTSCHWYLRNQDQMRSGAVSTTTRWQGPYLSEQEANRMTHVTRVCLDCNPLPKEDPPRRGVVITDVDVPFSRIMAIVFQWGLAIFIWYLVVAVITISLIALLWSSVNNS